MTQEHKAYLYKGKLGRSPSEFMGRSLLFSTYIYSLSKFPEKLYLAVSKSDIYDILNNSHTEISNDSGANPSIRKSSLVHSLCFPENIRYFIETEKACWSFHVKDISILDKPLSISIQTEAREIVITEDVFVVSISCTDVKQGLE